jgi:capsular exopolysaccharide synthesis family protein
LLVVTSSGASEGKTTISINLGRFFALIGRRVLLVDGDLRRHQLHQRLGVPNDVGLATVLQGGVCSRKPLEMLIQRTAQCGLSVLTSGPASESSANLLHSSEFATLLKQLRRMYDIVIVDTPPMLPVADARVIGRLADGVVLVVRAGHTDRNAVVTARQRLEMDGISVLGMVLNDWDPACSRHNYYATYNSTSPS